MVSVSPLCWYERQGIHAQWLCCSLSVILGIPLIWDRTFVPRKGGLGLPWVPPLPPLGSPPDIIWNSVDPYCGVLTDMK